MDFKTSLLTELLNCGYADIDFLEKEMNNFEIEIDDLDISEEINLNLIIRSIYEIALDRFDIDPYDEEWMGRIGIYTNSLDSHLWIDDEEIYSIEQIKEISKKSE